MKIKNINDASRFLKVVCNCKGDVELVTNQGDRLNLKSKLCACTSLNEYLTEAKMEDIEIILHDPEDFEMLTEFLVRG